MPSIETVLPDRRDILGEAAFWHVGDGALYWVDIVSRLVSRLSKDGQVTDWTLEEPVSAVIPRDAGGLVVALASGIALLDPDSGATAMLSRPDAANPGNRSNEARCDPQGRLWLGTMRNNIGPGGENLPMERSSGALYCVSADGGSVCLETGFGIPNTLAWSPDGGTLYLADTTKATIYAYDYDPDGPGLGGKRVFATPKGLGVPDGSAMDSEGCLWNARWGAGCLLRLRPDGGIDRIVELPVSNPTCCAFGGSDLRTLYVTSTRHGMPEDAVAANPLEGALLALRTEVAGLPLTCFGG
jgi:sugar lactone lactonase YvrE